VLSTNRQSPFPRREPVDIAVVTDRTVYLLLDLLEKYTITVTPLDLFWGDETFCNGVVILPEEHNKRLATSKVMLTTAQFGIVTMKATFEKLPAEGCCILGIFISGKPSGRSGWRRWLGCNNFWC
jgi:fatty acid-binding protein DegV